MSKGTAVVVQMSTVVVRRRVRLRKTRDTLYPLGVSVPLMGTVMGTVGRTVRGVFCRRRYDAASGMRQERTDARVCLSVAER